MRAAIARLPSVGTHQGVEDTINTDGERVIFIVDTDPAVRDSVAALVRTLGGHPYCFESGEECLEAIASQKPECLISEVSLPGMDGMQLLSELRARAPDTPTIFLALRGSINAAVLAMRSGAIDYIEKPFIDRQLATRIRELCHLEAQVTHRHRP